jgi:hypothetical protein
MLLAPGPAAEDIPPGPLMVGLLQRLQDSGLVPEVSVRRRVCCDSYVMTHIE